MTTGGEARDPIIGSTIAGRFEVLEFIARGGMGSVYRGRQLPLGRACAIKVLHPTLQGDERMDFHHRFFLEASTSAKLSHPNTVTVFDYGKAEGDLYYMAMEYLEGRTLREAIKQDAPFREERVLHVARQICRSLREAHGMGVIHRDLKPANIFLVQHGDEADMVKVLDFGLVKNVNDTDQQQTQAGICMGSPKYMAPEQVTGARVDARTDVYALGILMYEMLTGRVPFDRGNRMTTIMAQVTEEVPPMRTVKPELALSADLERVVMRCLAKLPDERYKSMDDVLTALKLGGSVITTTMGEHTRGGTSGSPVVRDVTGSGDAPALSSASPALTSHSGDHLAVLAMTAGKKRVAMAGGLVAAAAVALTTFFVATRSGKDGAVQPSAVVAAAGAATARSPAAIPAVQATPPAARLQPPPSRLRVTSEPAGASVKEDGVEVCAATPCDLRYEGADATRPHKLLLSMPGFKGETRTVSPGDASVSVTLARAAVVAAPARPRAAREAVPGGYKIDVPY